MFLRRQRDCAVSDLSRDGGVGGAVPPLRRQLLVPFRENWELIKCVMIVPGSVILYSFDYFNIPFVPY